MQLSHPTPNGRKLTRGFLRMLRVLFERRERLLSPRFFPCSPTLPTRPAETAETC